MLRLWPVGQATIEDSSERSEGEESNDHQYNDWLKHCEDRVERERKKKKKRKEGKGEKGGIIYD